MRVKVDSQSDVLYVRLDESNIVESEEVQPGLIVDYDAANNIIGFELLNVSRRVPMQNLKNILFESI